MTSLIFGGNGGLGRAIISHFKPAMTTISIDFTPNQDASHNIPYSSTVTVKELSKQIHTILQGKKVDSIINVAGGWAGGNLTSEDLVEKTNLMFQQSVISCVIAGQLATQYLKEYVLMFLLLF